MVMVIRVGKKGDGNRQLGRFFIELFCCLHREIDTIRMYMLYIFISIEHNRKMECMKGCDCTHCTHSHTHTINAKNELILNDTHTLRIRTRHAAGNGLGC